MRTARDSIIIVHFKGSRYGWIICQQKFAIISFEKRETNVFLHLFKKKNMYMWMFLLINQNNNLLKLICNYNLISKIPSNHT